MVYISLWLIVNKCTNAFNRKKACISFSDVHFNSTHKKIKPNNKVEGLTIRMNSCQFCYLVNDEA